MVSTTNIYNVTSNTTLSSNYNTYIVNATNSNITLTLPLITCNGINFVIYRNDSTSNSVTLNSSGSNVITTNSGFITNTINLSSQSVTNLQTYNNSWYFMIPTGVQGITGPTGPSVPFPPVPNPDYYKGRTNQLIPINVVSGITGNFGGIDTPGGTLTNPTNAITSVTIVTPPSFGTLTATGGVGSYTYRSDPRFTGLDQFMYKVTDSTGIMSKNNAICYVNILSLVPAGTGPSFSFCTDTSIYTSTNGVTGFLCTPSFPGGTGLTATSMNALAVNRDDNLLYYVLNNTSSANSGKIWAYDYVNNTEFLLVDANNSSAFGTTGIDFGFQSTTSGTYANYNYFIMVSNTSSYYIVNVNAYDPTTGGQTINSATKVSLGLTFQPIGLMMNPNTNRLIMAGFTGTSGTTGLISTFVPYTGSIIKSVSFSGPTGYILAPGVCSEIYAIANGTTSLLYINPSNASTSSTGSSFPPTGFTSATSYISPVPN
jgi:hypothetical protein